MDEHAQLTITQFLKLAYGERLQGILLFGSQADGSAHSNSDVDLGILLTGVVEADEVWENAQTLACRLRKDVDLIDLRSTSTVLQKEAILNGYWIWQKNTFLCDQFEVQVMAMYQQLQYDRREILDEIKKRLNHE